MSTLKRSTSVFQGLDKKIKCEPTTQFPSPASTIDLDDSPSHFELEPATPTVYITPVKQEPMTSSSSSAQNALKFMDGLKRYNGYTCKFLKKPMKLQVFSSAMSVTCNSSVAVFSMPRLIRARLIQKVDELLEAVATGPLELKKNPFARSPVFLAVGHHARLFRQLAPGAAAEPFSAEELKRGMYFHGRLSLDIMGVKSSNTTNELSVMLRVKELYMMADHVSRVDDNDENMGTCSLEEPIDGEDGSQDEGTDY